MSAFQSFGLNQAILQSIAELGFEIPTPIQASVIPKLMEGSGDIVGLAQTGTGKTAAFGLPILHRLQPDLHEVQALILSPTRELAVQITKDLSTYAKYMPAIKVLTIYGGASIDKQSRSLRDGVQVIVATPGRLVDFIHRGKVHLDHLQVVVLDEADEMLNMGFKEELDLILSAIPDTRQTLLFSATMPKDVARIAQSYMKKAVTLSAGNVNTTNADIRHYAHLVHEKDRYEVLKRIADAHPDIYGIVFCRTRQETQAVADKLRKDRYPAESLHGDLTQIQRDMVMSKFRERQIRILVATDVAARGLDVREISHIIHYNLPDDLEVYTHRAGRTGRAGKTGTSVSIVNFKEKGKLRFLERSLSVNIPMKSIPTGRDICMNQLHHVIDNIHKAEIREDQIGPFLVELEEKLMHLDRDTLIKKVLSMEFNRFNDDYAAIPDLNSPDLSDRRPDRDRDRKEKSSDYQFSRFFLNLGKMDGLAPKALMAMVSDVTGKRNIEIGKIEIGKTHTFFEADTSFENQILESFRNAEHEGRTIIIDRAEKKRPPQNSSRRPRMNRRPR